MANLPAIRLNAQPLNFTGDKPEIGDRAEFVSKMFRLLSELEVFSIGMNESLSDLNQLVIALNGSLQVNDTAFDTAQKRVDALKLVQGVVQNLGVSDVSGLRAELDFLALNGGRTKGNTNALRLPPGGILGSGRHHVLDMRVSTEAIVWEGKSLQVGRFTLPDGENDAEILSFVSEGPHFALLQGWFITLDGSVTDNVVIGLRGKQLEAHWVSSESAWAIGDAADRPRVLPESLPPPPVMSVEIVNSAGPLGTMTVSVTNGAGGGTTSDGPMTADVTNEP